MHTYIRYVRHENDLTGARAETVFFGCTEDRLAWSKSPKRANDEKMRPPRIGSRPPWGTHNRTLYTPHTLYTLSYFAATTLTTPVQHSITFCTTHHGVRKHTKHWSRCSTATEQETGDDIVHNLKVPVADDSLYIGIL